MALSAYEDAAFGPEEIQLNFRFQINGTTHPDFVVGGAMSVQDITYVSAGVFDILMARGCAFEDLITCFVDPEALAFGGKFVSWTQATRMLRVTTYGNDGTPAAADPTDNSWVHVRATWCRRSKLADARAI